MGRILDIAALILLFSVTSRTLAPQYSPGWRTTSLLLLADLVVISVYRIFIYPKFLSPLRSLPSPPDNHWFWGQTLTIWREPSGYPHIRWIDEVPNDGVIKYNNWFGDRVFISNSKALAEVLVTKSYDFVKPPRIRITLARILGAGILLAEGDDHRRQRKMLMPAFAFRHVKELYPAFWSKSRQLVEVLAKATQSKETREHAVDKVATTHAPGIVEVYEQASKATLDIIGASGMGHDFDTLENPDNRLTRAYKSIFSVGEARGILRIIAAFIPPWIMNNLPMRRNQTLGTAMSDIQQVCQDLVDESREALREKPESRRDIISVALESGGFNDEELRNQMTTFLLAGHETTSTALTWAIYLLCKHPDVQTKLRAAVRASIPPLDRSQEVTSTQIDDCHYLHAVCSEVLRLWSPVPMTMRVAANDTTVSGHFIPKGTLVVLATWAVNRAVAFWGPDAKEFRPERWLDAATGRANNRGGAESNYSFLTFLHGPRSCIGQKFAEAEFACLLAAWVGRYETVLEAGSALAKDEEPVLRGGITTKPRDGVWVKLTEVEGW